MQKQEQVRRICKVRKVGGTLVVTIPKDLAKVMNINQGDRVMISSIPCGLKIEKE